MSVQTAPGDSSLIGVKGWWFQSPSITLCFTVICSLWFQVWWDCWQSDSQNRTMNAPREEAQVQNPWRRDGIAHDKNCQLCFLCFESCLWPHVWGESVGRSFYCKPYWAKSGDGKKSSGGIHHMTVRWLLITNYEYNFNLQLKVLHSTWKTMKINS